ncbi:GIN domain-containing protein [Sphingomonas sp.]|uniref:GIN domain-containing protein n=1 Tax=Sphingomonas sp. TaxID=28214 RepID=UPI0035C78F51
MRRGAIAILPGLLIAAPAVAAERVWSIGSIERVRVEAPVEVRIVTGAGNGVRATASDAATLARLTVVANGDTLLIRQPRGAAPATADDRATVTVSTPRLAAVALYSAATVAVDAMRGDRIDLSVTEGGTLTIEQIDSPMLAATLVGDGAMTLAGRAGDVRLIANGHGVLHAAGLAVDRLAVQALDTAEVTATARFAASVNATGTSLVTVTSPSPCTVRRSGDAQVTCGR